MVLKSQVHGCVCTDEQIAKVELPSRYGFVLLLFCNGSLNNCCVQEVKFYEPRFIVLVFGTCMMFGRLQCLQILNAYGTIVPGLLLKTINLNLRLSRRPLIAL